MSCRRWPIDADAAPSGVHVADRCRCRRCLRANPIRPHSVVSRMVGLMRNECAPRACRWNGSAMGARDQRPCLLFVKSIGYVNEPLGFIAATLADNLVIECE